MNRPERFTCTHGKVRYIARTLAGVKVLLARYCGKRAVGNVEGCPACARHLRNPKAA